MIELMAAGASTRETGHHNVFTSTGPSRPHHFCVAADDLGQATSALAERGVTLVGGSMEVAELGQYIACITGDLGNLISPRLAPPATA